MNPICNTTLFSLGNGSNTSFTQNALLDTWMQVAQTHPKEEVLVYKSPMWWYEESIGQYQTCLQYKSYCGHFVFRDKSLEGMRCQRPSPTVAMRVKMRSEMMQRDVGMLQHAF